MTSNSRIGRSGIFKLGTEVDPMTHYAWTLSVVKRSKVKVIR